VTVVDKREEASKEVLTRRVDWLKLSLIVVAFAILGLVLSGVLIYFLRPHFTLPKTQWIGYLSIFAIVLVMNLSFIPLPFVISILISAAAVWNPWLVALVCSLGACIGEMSGYYAGILGKKIAIPDNLSGYRLMKRWIDKYGFWAIVLISFQPLLPIEVAGIISGAARMPVHKFLPALLLGKIPKYIILMYSGLGIIHFIPFLKV
jgi:membrane protein YqaA with SNARE-associated domain